MKIYTIDNHDGHIKNCQVRDMLEMALPEGTDTENLTDEEIIQKARWVQICGADTERCPNCKYYSHYNGQEYCSVMHLPKAQLLPPEFKKYGCCFYVGRKGGKLG